VDNDDKAKIEAAAELIEEIQEHQREVQESQAAADRRPRSHFVRNISVAVVLSLGMFTALQSHISVQTQPAFDDNGLRSSLDLTLLLTVEGLNAFRASNGALPKTLAEAGIDDPDLQYVAQGESYEIRGQQGSHKVLYVDGDDLSPYRQAYASLSTVDPESP